MIALWILSGLAGVIWIGWTMIPAMIDDVNYGNEIELSTVVLVLMMGLCGIILALMCGPFIPAFYGLALLIQRILNARRNRQ